ncbi:hypothetical protein K3495_g6919 [Podosphaera aphanis]|nr:hypothetical protein K3495_g6919 [Podosphaera aphanis]
MLEYEEMVDFMMGLEEQEKEERNVVDEIFVVLSVDGHVRSSMGSISGLVHEPECLSHGRAEAAQIILGQSWMQKHDCGLRPGQQKIAFDSTHCTTHFKSHRGKVIVKALKISNPSKIHPKSEVLRPGRIIEDSTTPLSVKKRQELQLIEENSHDINKDFDIKLGSPRAIETYTRSRRKQEESICGVFVRDLGPEVMIENFNLNKISRGDFAIFMKDKIDPKFHDKPPLVYYAWQDVFSRKAANELPS